MMFLNHTPKISGAQKSYVARGYDGGQSRYWTCSSSQNPIGWCWCIQVFEPVVYPVSISSFIQTFLENMTFSDCIMYHYVFVA